VTAAMQTVSLLLLLSLMPLVPRREVSVRGGEA
jgi:hypothetical protein